MLFFFFNKYTISYFILKVVGVKLFCLLQLIYKIISKKGEIY